MKPGESYDQQDVESLALMQLVGMSLMDMTTNDSIFRDEFADERQILRLVAVLILYIKRRIAACLDVPDHEIDSMMTTTLEHYGLSERFPEEDSGE